MIADVDEMVGGALIVIVTVYVDLILVSSVTVINWV